MLGDLFELGAEIAVGTVTGSLGAKVGKETAKQVSGGNKTVENIGEIVGALAGGYAGASAVDSLFNLMSDDDWFYYSNCNEKLTSLKDKDKDSKTRKKIIF